MATLREYFDTDFSRVIKVSSELNLKSNQKVPSELDPKLDHIEVLVNTRVLLDFDSGTKYLSYFVPTIPMPLAICASVLKSSIRRLAESVADGVEIQEGFLGDMWDDSTALKFSGRVFIYAEDELTAEQVSALEQLAATEGLSVRFRGPRYAAQRNIATHPLAFICHDSRDKTRVARPLANQLWKMMCPVWYDEFSLRVGDSLRESIEKGIKECRKCILVLSPRFFSNNGWTKVEFNSVFTRQIIEKRNIVLPLWCGVSAREVYEYSPSLADKVGIKWRLGVEEVARRLYREITS